MMNSNDSETVTLKGGLHVSLDSLRLLWALEDRGCVIRNDGDRLVVGPRARISDGERQQIRARRDELLALVAYCDTELLT